MTALLLRFWWAPVIALALTFAAIQTTRLKSAQSDLSKAKATIVALNDAKAASEAARGREATAATNSFNALQSACAVSLVEATKRGRLVERIIHAPPNPDGSRGLVSDVSLRALMDQAGSESVGGSVHQ